MTVVEARTIDWLMAGDPAIQWQTMRDLLGAPEQQWVPLRARVETEGWGAALLARQGDDGLWAGGVFVPAHFTRADWESEGQPWTATAFTLNLLRELGLPPDCPSALRTVRQVGENSRWDEGGQQFWDGEVEECINGRTIADGAYFGVDMTQLVQRILGERQADGGWNCERVNGSRRSSIDTTINVLEGLLAYESSTGRDSQVSAARRSGEEFLLERSLFRRLRTGDVADPDFLILTYPRYWRYDVLRALDYFRAASAFDQRGVDPRATEAIEHVRGRRTTDGLWVRESAPRGRAWFELEPVGGPSRSVTLRALRVLNWADAGISDPVSPTSASD